jgi:hypothetical protein
VAAGIVRWIRGEEYGLETLVRDEESRMDLMPTFPIVLPMAAIEHNPKGISTHQMAARVAPGEALLLLIRGGRLSGRLLFFDGHHFE